MSNENQKRSKVGRGWMLLIAAVIVIGGVWFWMKSERAAESEQAALVHPSTEWTTAPEGGVQVDLPKAPMTNTPVESPAPVTEPAPDAKPAPTE